MKHFVDHRRTWLLFVGLLAVAFFAAQGCLPPLKTTCHPGSSCPSGKVCRNNQCVDGCEADVQCAAGQICVDGSCMTSSGEPAPDTTGHTAEQGPETLDAGPDDKKKPEQPDDQGTDTPAPTKDAKSTDDSGGTDDSSDAGQGPDGANEPSTNPDSQPDSDGSMDGDGSDSSDSDGAEPIADGGGADEPGEVTNDRAPTEQVPEVKPACVLGQSRVCGVAVGVCKARIQRCTTKGEWGPCVWPVTPGKEVCTNLKDDDCDGYVDEGCSLPTFSLVQTIAKAHTLSNGTTPIPVSDLSWARDGVTLASLSIDPRELRPVRIWKPMQKPAATQVKLATTSRTNVITFDPLQARFVVGLQDGRALLWTPGTTQVPIRIQGSSRDIAALRFRPDGLCLAVAYGASVQVWDVKQRKPAYTSAIPSPSSLSYHPDGVRLLVSTDGSGGELRILSLQAGKVTTTTVTKSTYDLPQAVFSGEGDAIALALRAFKDNVSAWTLGAPGQPAKALSTWKHFRSGAPPATIDWHPHASLVAVGGQGTYMTMWDPRNITPGLAHQDIKVDPYTKGVEKIVFRPDGKAFAAGLINGSIAVYGVTCKVGDPARSCYTHAPRTSGVGLCRPGQQTCVLGPDTKTYFWSPCTGETLPTPEIMDGKDNNCDGFIDEVTALCQ